MKEPIPPFALSRQNSLSCGVTAALSLARQTSMGAMTNRFFTLKAKAWTKGSAILFGLSWFNPNLLSLKAAATT